MTFTVLTLLTALGLLIEIGLPKSLPELKAIIGRASMPARRRDSLNRRTSLSTAVPALALLSIPSIKLLAIERMVSPLAGKPATITNLVGLFPAWRPILATWDLTAAACRRRNSIPSNKPTRSVPAGFLEP